MTWNSPACGWNSGVDLSTGEGRMSRGETVMCRMRCKFSGFIRTRRKISSVFGV